MSRRDNRTVGELPADGSDVEVTSHAVRRYLQRIDAETPYPQTAIERAWAAVFDGSKEPPAQGVTLVADVHGLRPTVVTVFPSDSTGIEVREA